MNSEVHYLFPTPTLIKRVDDPKFMDEYKAIGDLHFTYCMKPYWGVTHKLFPSYNTFGRDVIHEQKLDHLHKLVDDAVAEYCGILEIPKDPYNRTSWFTLCEKGDYAHTHTHGKADISGVFYYEVGSSAGNLFFCSPIEAAKISGVYTKHHVSNVVHKAEVGKMILFPGWLNHGVTTNDNDDRRVSLSFNIFFKRD